MNHMDSAFDSNVPYHTSKYAPSSNSIFAQWNVDSNIARIAAPNGPTDEAAWGSVTRQVDENANQSAFNPTQNVLLQSMNPGHLMRASAVRGGNALATGQQLLGFDAQGNPGTTRALFSSSGYELR